MGCGHSWAGVSWVPDLVLPLRWSCLCWSTARGIYWESPIPWVCGCDRESLQEDVKGFRENNNRVFMVSASDSVPEKQFILLFFPMTLV